MNNAVRQAQRRRECFFSAPARPFVPVLFAKRHFPLLGSPVTMMIV